VAARERREMARHAGGVWSVVEAGADLHRLGAAGRLGAVARTGAGAAGDRSWNGVSRRHLNPGAPEGGGRGEKRGTSAERDHREALGRSRGGFGTKACVIADGKGRAVAFAVAPGQAHEVPLAPDLIAELPEAPGWFVGDRGLSANALRELIWAIGAKPAIPPKRNEAEVACRSWIYQNRNMVERLWARLKEWRAVATRYEKTAQSFLGVLCLAATFDWIRS
jgi:transposase